MAESLLVLVFFSVMALTHQSETRTLHCDRLIKLQSRSETKQGTVVPKIYAKCGLDGGQRTELTFDISEPLNIEGVYNSHIFLRVTVLLTCWSPIVLNFSNQGNLVYKNILLDLRIGEDYKVLMQNLDVWANATYLRSIQ